MASFWTTAELLQLGKSPHDIRRAADGLLIEPVRKGHWVTPGADPQVVRAARVGGVATATTASRSLGLWTPPDLVPDGGHGTGSAFRRRRRLPDHLQVAVPNTASRLRDPDDATRPLRDRPDVVVHWVDPAAMSRTGRSRVADPLLLLAHTFSVQPPERALAVVESALKQRHILMRDLPALAAVLPAHLHPVLRQATPRADSGLETIVRTLLRARGLHVEALAAVKRVGEVDLLVEGRLLIELDGREFHEDDDAFERDRARDVAATIDRYRVLRLSWFQVLFQWDRAEAAVFAALAA